MFEELKRVLSGSFSVSAFKCAAVRKTEADCNRANTTQNPKVAAFHRDVVEASETADLLLDVHSCDPGCSAPYTLSLSYGELSDVFERVGKFTARLGSTENFVIVHSACPSILVEFTPAEDSGGQARRTLAAVEAYFRGL